ncbi:putative Undecaprenyl-diphosphatase [Nitrospira moscoviensis]|uniref:Putative Undecaprenyl-diphosphatase n=2 Tax=Nitrospira moscoviensis TaxID=42253 RepID=A0A0K2GGU7_NITMO|nr:putative Undecaprenyl-diphosphatase [Nitrospira moscoviensis]
MQWDESLLRVINGLAGQSAVLDWLALMLSNAGLLWAPGILLALYWLWLSWREMVIAAPLLAASIGVLDFVGARLKDLAARPRPCMALPDIHQIEACGKVFGFPSNHAINTATVAGFLHVLYPRSGWISWPLVGFIGLTRVYIGAHYPTDVIAGWLIGGLCGAGAAWLLKQWPVFCQLRSASMGRPDSPQAGSPQTDKTLTASVEKVG